MDRRISPPRDFEALLDRLTEPGPGTQPALFSSKQKALMFAAGVGHSLGERLPLERKGTAIRMDVFQKALDDGYIDALAVLVTDSLQVLSIAREDDRATIFEEYAHRGLVEIQRRCFDAPGDPMDILVQMVDEALSPSDIQVPGIDTSLLKDLVG
jgi:dnd system-associated protein 4